MLSVQRLRVLTEVASQGSFSRAAAALAYTPSAVSQAIATLEAETGATLVERDRRGVRPTAAGRVRPRAAVRVPRGERVARPGPRAHRAARGPAARGPARRPPAGGQAPPAPGGPQRPGVGADVGLEPVRAPRRARLPRRRLRAPRRLRV